FDPTAFEDHYETALVELLRKKQAGFKPPKTKEHVESHGCAPPQRAGGAGGAGAYEVRKPEEYFSDIEDIKVPGEMLKLAEHIVERSVVPSMPLPHGSKAMTRSRLASTMRPSATMPLSRMASRMTANASCPTLSVGAM